MRTKFGKELIGKRARIKIDDRIGIIKKYICGDYLIEGIKMSCWFNRDEFVITRSQEA